MANCRTQVKVWVVLAVATRGRHRVVVALHRTVAAVVAVRVVKIIRLWFGRRHDTGCAIGQHLAPMLELESATCTRVTGRANPSIGAMRPEHRLCGQGITYGARALALCGKRITYAD